MKYIYLLCSLFYMVNSVAQTANGTAVNSTNDEPLAFITIINKSTQEGVVANYSGAFSIKANLGKDTLEFSSNGFESLKLVAVENMEVKLSPTAIDINTVIITSNREQELREETPIGISSINTQTIEDNKPTTIDQVLNQTPGVNMVDLGNEQHTMSIRRPIDYGASYLYLEDGVPIRTSGVFNHNALLEINMANVSKIEIVRGPASSMYGSEAIGGAVNFISKKPTLNQTAGVSIQGNNIGYKRTDFYASNTIKKKFGYRLAGYYADQTNGIVEHSDFNKLALSLNMRYNISEKSELLWSNSYIDYYSDMSGSLDSTDFFDKENLVS